jgi:bacteriocin biosynthesis cyclodehydratase domain-containing protein
VHERDAVSARYVPSSHWSLQHEDGLLVLSAGADELFAIEDVRTDAAVELVEAWSAETIDADSLSAPTRDVFDRLVAAGIVTPACSDARTSKVSLHVVGTAGAELADALDSALAASSALELVEAERSELVVFVRASGRLAELYDGAPEWQHRPHLLLDVAYDHTISLGPLVFPGDTACLGCLIGRIAHYWGDAPAPARPRMLRYPALIASLLALEVEKIAAGDIGLVNTTVSWDLRGWEIRRDAVYKLPWCPRCGEPDGGEAIGSIDLPWTAAR